MAFNAPIARVVILCAKTPGTMAELLDQLRAQDGRVIDHGFTNAFGWALAELRKKGWVDLDKAGKYCTTEERAFDAASDPVLSMDLRKAFSEQTPLPTPP